MNLKHLLLPVMAILPVMSFAATYYVTPEGAGDKTGSSWENAFGVEEFRTQAAKNANGDIYNLAGGVYKPSALISFKGGTGFTLIGNADGERTVFSGDKDNNGVANLDDLNAIVKVNNQSRHGDNSKATKISNIDFTCVYSNNSNRYAENTALNIDNSGDVVVDNCNFNSNVSVGDYGGSAVIVYRSTVLFKNCGFRNNQGKKCGGAVRMRSDEKVDNAKEYVTFDQCVFTDNKISEAKGGVIYMAEGMQLNIINSTIANNSANSDGAAIYINDNETKATYGTNQLNIVGTTIANNTVNGDETGAQIALLQTAKVNLVNSIVVSNDEKTAAFSFAGETAGDNFSFVSGGWNYVGKVNGLLKEIAWQPTDNKGDECTFAEIFGENKLADGVIKPSKYVVGATGAETETAVAGWNIAPAANYAVDQLGNDRTADLTCGAVAVSKVTTGIDNVIAGGDDARLVVVGNGVYMIEGAEGIVEAYNIMGRRVAVAANGEISLENVAPGMYIIKAGNKTFKIVR